MAKPQTTAKKSTDLTIVIPAYREEHRIGKSLDELAEFLNSDKILKTKQVEVLVVSADSPDDTHGVVTSKKKNFKDFTLIKSGPKIGKGRDVQIGMLKAKGDAVVFMDADLATPLKHIPEFYSIFLEGCDLVVATRNLKKHHNSIPRRLLSNTGNLLYRILGGVWIEDSQCGFKLFSHSAAQTCFSRLTIFGWGFDMEILTIAKANKLSMKTVRVEDWKHVPNGQFELSAITNSMSSLLDLFKIGFKRLRRDYVKSR